MAAIIDVLIRWTELLTLVRRSAGAGVSDQFDRLLSKILAFPAAADWRVRLASSTGEAASRRELKQVLGEVERAIAECAPELSSRDRTRLASAVLGRLRPTPPADSSAGSVVADDDRARIHSRVLCEYPFPVARAYKRLQADIDESRDDRDALRQLILLKDAVETLVRYLTLAALSARLDRRDPVDDLDNEILGGLVAPALGTWAHLLARLVGAPGTLADSRMAPLVQFCTGAFFGQINEFNRLRNNVLAHGLVRNPREDRDDVALWLPRFEALMAAAEFLAEWELVQAEAPLRSWMGSDALDAHRPARADAARIAGIAPRHGEFVLAPPVGRPISLFPFIYLLDCPACGQAARVFLYDSQKEYTNDKKRIGMIENTGGHKEQFTEPAEALAVRFPHDELLKHYQYYRRQFETLEGKLTEFDFESYRQRVPYFVGRRPVLQALAAFLARQAVPLSQGMAAPVDRGYFLLVAGPGLGKTALWTHWIAHNANRAPVRFFWQAGRNLTPLDFLRHVYHGLLAKHQLTDRDPSPDERDYPRKLDALLKLLSERHLSDTTPEVIVVDALDEAGSGPARGAALAAVPRNLPPHIYFLLSSRPTDELNELACDPHCRRYELSATADWNRRDVREYVELQLGNMLAAGEIDAGLLPAIETAADGNFLWAVQFCAGVRAGALAARAIAETLPRIAGLDELYQEFWTRILRQLSEGAKSGLGRLTGILAVARTPLTAEQICRFAGMEDVEFVTLRGYLQQYLEEIVQPPERPWDAPLVGFRLYHASFRDFLLRQPGMVSRQHHERIARAYADSAGDSFESAAWDRYGLSFVLYHAIQARLFDTVDRLLGDDGFWIERSKRLKPEEALSQTREIAESLDQAGESRWDSLTACARRFCDQAEALRGDVGAWERMIGSGDVDRVVEILESDADTTRRGASMLAVGALVVEAGMHDRGYDLMRRGLESLGPKQREDFFRVPGCGVETTVLLHAMMKGPADLRTTADGQAPDARDVPSRTYDRLRFRAKRSVPWFDQALALLTPDRLFSYFICSLWVVMGFTLLVEMHVIRNGPPWTAISGIIFGTAISLWMGGVFGYAILHRVLDRHMEKLTARLARGMDESPPAQQRKLALQVVRNRSFWGPLPEGPAAASAAADLADVARQAVPLVADDSSAAARFLLDAACCGPAVCDALVAPLRRLPLDTLRAIFAQAARGWMRSWNFAPVVRLYVAVSDLIPDTRLLIALIKKHEDDRTELDRALEGAPFSFLARSLLTSLEASRISPLRRQLRTVGVWVQKLGLMQVSFRMSPAQMLVVLPFLTPGLLSMAGIGLAVVHVPAIAFLMVALAGRRYDVFSLAAKEPPPEPREWRMELSRKLFSQEPPLAVEPLDQRRVRDVIMAQNILRSDRAQLPPGSGSAGRRVMKRLIRGRLLDRPGKVLLNAMGDRTLLELVAGGRPTRGTTSKVRTIDADADREQLRRVLPIRPWWQSLTLFTLLGIAGTMIWLGMLALLAPRIRPWIAGYAVWQDAGSCLFLAVVYHVAPLLLRAGRVTFWRKSNWGKSSVREPLKPGAYRYLVGIACAIAIHVFSDSVSSSARRAGLEVPGLGGFGLDWLPTVLPMTPLVIANGLVPEFIARWRGGSLLYPRRAPLWRYRIFWTGYSILALFLLAAFVPLGFGQIAPFVYTAIGFSILAAIVLVPFIL